MVQGPNLDHKDKFILAGHLHKDHGIQTVTGKIRFSRFGPDKNEKERVSSSHFIAGPKNVWLVSHRNNMNYSSLQVNTVVFDKTGTLTHGKQEVVALKIFFDVTFMPWRLFLAIVGTAELKSEHPLGKALKKYVLDVSIEFHYILI